MNELRSKNVKITNDLLKSEDAIDELKQELNKKDKFIDDLEKQIEMFINERRQLQQEKQQEIKKIDEVDANMKLNELNLELKNQLSLKENEQSSLENENNELKQELNKLKERISENSLKYEQQINEISELKDKEVQYFQNECNKLASDNEKLASLTSKLQQNKRQLEEELILYNEKKEAISKCEQQMNEILQMVNEERLVRDNLKYLASKLIQEVDTLRSQCIYTTTPPAPAAPSLPTSTSITSSNNILITSNNATGDTNNTNTWRNRCSERRDRINVQNLQVSLEKEIQAKEEIMNENKSLKLEIDLKQTKIVELQLIIEDLNEKIIKSNEQQYLLKQSNNNNNYEGGYDNLANLKPHQIPPKQQQISPTHQNTPSISELVNGDTLYAIDDDDDMETNNETKPPDSIKLAKISPTTTANNLKYSKSLKILPTQHKENNNLSNSSTLSSVNVSCPPPSTPTTPQITPITPSTQQQHRFEVVSFQTMERCMLCTGVLYGIYRQAVKCKNKNCSYLCHIKCRFNLPDNCPLNINQQCQLKSVNFNKVSGTLMQGTLKIPKPGGVKKGWTEHYVFISNARLFICPIIDNSKAGIIPVQIVDIRDTQFSVSNVNESDVIHANKRDLQCIFKVIVTKLKQPDLRQQILFCAKDVKDKESWIQVLRELNDKLIHNTRSSNNKLSTILLVKF